MQYPYAHFINFILFKISSPIIKMKHRINYQEAACQPNLNGKGIYPLKNEKEIEKEFADEYRMIGLNIAYYRKLRKLTQIQLAEKTGISRTHMSNIEAPNVPTSISLNVILKISKVLDIPPSKILSFPLDE